MVELELTAEVDEQHRVELQLPDTVQPGVHRIAVRLDEEPAAGEQEPSLADLAPRKQWRPTPHIPWLELDPNFSMRRSDWYEDDT